MSDLGELLGGLAAIVVNIAIFTVIMGTGMGVVREHCVDLDQARAGVRDVDSGWTFILWPPLVFANLDPAGGCVRNAPLHEGLSALGIWELPSPEAQIDKHIRQQIDDGAEIEGSPSAESTPGASPRTVTREYLDAFVAMDGVGMCQRLTPESKRRLAKEVERQFDRNDLPCPQIMVSLAQSVGKKLRDRVAKLRIVDVEVSGDRAVVRGTEGSPQRLLRVNGEWLLVSGLVQ